MVDSTDKIAADKAAADKVAADRAAAAAARAAPAKYDPLAPVVPLAVVPAHEAYPNHFDARRGAQLENHISDFAAKNGFGAALTEIENMVDVGKMTELEHTRSVAIVMAMYPVNKRQGFVPAQPAMPAIDAIIPPEPFVRPFPKHRPIAVTVGVSTTPPPGTPGYVAPGQPGLLGTSGQMAPASKVSSTPR